MPASAAQEAGRLRLGEQLLQAGRINRLQLEAALAEQSRRGVRLGEALVSLGFLTPEELAEALAEEAGTRCVRLDEVEPEAQALARVPHALAERLRALPLRVDETRGEMEVALADPADVVAVDTLERETGLHVRVLVAPEDDITTAIERFYAQRIRIEDTIRELMEGGAPADGETSPMILLANQLLIQAANARATDLHIEPGENIVRVRMRVDGVLQKLALIPKPLHAGLVARFKVMAGMDVAEKRAPQDGRIRFRLGRRRLDLRVSTLPAQHGESVVIRILDARPQTLDLDKLSMSAHNRKRFEKMLAHPHGVILVTGPTGSGKTTTLYAALARMDLEQKSAFTLEDPIEYELARVRQVQVRPEVGLTFAAGLRALLRQDPDIILLGEMRDEETAQLAMRAALTGHLVLSTLHTNDAAGAVPRLLDMGLPGWLIAAALVGVVAQRLVRRLCPHCREEDPLAEQRLAALGLQAHARRPRLWRARGCPRCRDTGFSGRIAIHETLPVSEAMQAAIVRGASVNELRRLARRESMRPLFLDGLTKALVGETTLDEVLHTASLEVARG